MDSYLLKNVTRELEYGLDSFDDHYYDANTSYMDLCERHRVNEVALAFTTVLSCIGIVVNYIVASVLVMRREYQRSGSHWYVTILRSFKIYLCL